MKNSPMQLSLRKMRDDGWTCAIVEHFNPWAKIRQDLFGFADILAISPSCGILAVQCTTGANFSKRVAKIKATATAGIWLASGGRIIVHGWSKQGTRGKRKTWQRRVLEITNLSDR